MTDGPIITYCHADNLNVRFRQYAKDPVPGWAVDVMPEPPRGLTATAVLGHTGSFTYGDLVRKKSGSAWQGRVVGWYSTKLTICGYAVESSAHPGSVQIYPAEALELLTGLVTT